METGAFGRRFQDQIQPVLNDYDRQIDDMKSGGAHAEIARMQVMDDVASPANSGDGGYTGAGFIPADGSYQHDGFPLTGPNTGVPGGYGDDPNFHPAHLAVGAGPSMRAAPPSAALLNLSSSQGVGSNIATVPSLDDAAKSSPFNLSDRDLVAIRNRSDIQQGIQLGASTLAGPVVERVLPEEGIIRPIGKLVGKAIDAYDGIHELAEPSEAEKFEQAYQHALFDQLNGMTMQRSLSASTPPSARGFFP